MTADSAVAAVKTDNAVTAVAADSAVTAMCTLLWQRCQLSLLSQWCAHRCHTNVNIAVTLMWTSLSQRCQCHQGARTDGRGNEPVGSCAMCDARSTGRERSRGRTVEKWPVKTKFCSTYKVHCYGWMARHFSLPFGSGHLYTICKLSVLNNRIIVSQIKVNICEIN